MRTTSCCPPILFIFTGKLNTLAFHLESVPEHRHLLFSQMPMLRQILQVERKFQLRSPENFKSDGGQHDVVLTEAYSQAYIPSVETTLTDLPREFLE